MPVIVTKTQIDELADSFVNLYSEEKPDYHNLIDPNLVAQQPTLIRDYFVGQAFELNSIYTPHGLIQFGFGLRKVMILHSIAMILTLPDDYYCEFNDYTKADLLELAEDMRDELLEYTFPQELEDDESDIEQYFVNPPLPHNTLFQVINSNREVMLTIL
jgi:hypothetical protein